MDFVQAAVNMINLTAKQMQKQINLFSWGTWRPLLSILSRDPLTSWWTLWTWQALRSRNSLKDDGIVL